MHDRVERLRALKKEHVSTFSCHNANILENISLEISKGDLVGIAGKTGSGKSTFVNIMCGLMAPTEGSLIVDSRDIERLSKGDVIQIIESEYNEKVYKVKLLSGYNKNRNFYVIAEDLLNYYKPSQEQIYE